MVKEELVEDSNTITLKVNSIQADVPTANNRIYPKIALEKAVHASFGMAVTFDQNGRMTEPNMSDIGITDLSKVIGSVTGARIDEDNKLEFDITLYNTGVKDIIAGNKSNLEVEMISSGRITDGGIVDPKYYRIHGINIKPKEQGDNNE
jgi:hypothetical protein